MQNFIYVFSTDARDALIKAGYKLLKSDEDEQCFVFINKAEEEFACTFYEFALSNILTF